MEALRQEQQEWLTASEENRAIARQRFMNTLYAFNELVRPKTDTPEGGGAPLNHNARAARA